MILICLTLTLSTLYAQTPMGINYQSVIRDGKGNVLNNATVKLKISIISGSSIGPVEYSETHLPTTNNYGLISLVIGSGNILTGALSTIDWSIGNYYIKIEVDPTGGENYQVSGISQLMSVPYAMHAKTVETDLVDDADADPENEIQTLNLTGNQLSISNGNSVTLPPTNDADADPANEIQTLAISGNNLTINRGNTVSLPIPAASPWTKNGTALQYSLGNVEIGSTSSPSILKVRGNTSGIYCESTTGYAVYGTAHSATGYTAGGFFETKADVGKAVYGYASSTTGSNVGGYFNTKSNQGSAVLALASSLTGYTKGGYFVASSDDGMAIYAKATSQTGTTYAGHFTSSSSGGYGVWASGGLYDFYAAGAGANFGAASSKRWKNNIRLIDSPIEKVNALRGVYFDWDKEHGGKHDLGFIAEEVGKILPEIVVFEENGIDAIGLDYSKLTPLLVEAIKEQQKLIKELTKRIEILEAK